MNDNYKRTLEILQLLNKAAFIFYHDNDSKLLDQFLLLSSLKNFTPRRKGFSQFTWDYEETIKLKYLHQQISTAR